ncbi:cytochrome-c oxidase, cbb3-type subunit III [Alcanivorax sp. 1008]|uniref:cytochrome-c oxidase, cbb3-type subunit III n=1 Tax=Alcanivorax sp. 1008 TaxID=2816853 RepID=UPI001D904B13|nr:cytochrome-c oxidase, cbb3-type subunit III [Alcanivorax sp. 1008]MCC1497759.1 cytochrome-c oxidase, cbb3-type subunit III [Alcanivorax sp. 1008]
MTDFWSWYIIALTVLMLVGCAGLLIWNRSISHEEATKKTTGHVFDGIEEKNTPLPRWWLGLFILTLVFAVVYLALYPGLGKYPGLLGWTQAGQWQEEVDFVHKQTQPIFEQYAQVPADELWQHQEVMEVGARLFANNCATCHGGNANGARGYPNLTDNDWLYGGTPEAIRTTLINGRRGMMPPMIAAIGGTDEAARDMALYVQSLSRPALRDDPAKLEAIERAAPRFMVCAACHGADATGNQMLGAPNLTDDIWLYGGSLADIEEGLKKGRGGVMPAFSELLSAERIHVLTAYVYGLSKQE